MQAVCGFQHATAALSCRSFRSLRYLRNNKLGGELPDAWGSFRDLRTIALDGNLLDSSLPDAWGELSSIENLDLKNNSHIFGSLPDAPWSTLADTLQMIDMRHNLFFYCDTDVIPSTWPRPAYPYFKL
jgi:hypothetical protein